MGNRIDLAVIRRNRATRQKSHFAAFAVRYAIGFAVLTAFLSLAARQ